MLYNKIGDNFSLYLLIIFYSSLSFIPYYPELSVQLILPFTIMIITSTFLFTAFNTLILQLFTISLFCILYSKSAQLPFSTRSSNAISAPTPISALSHSPTMVIAGVFLGIIIDDMIIIITDYFSFICLFFYLKLIACVGFNLVLIIFYFTVIIN